MLTRSRAGRGPPPQGHALPKGCTRRNSRSCLSTPLPPTAIRSEEPLVLRRVALRQPPRVLGSERVLGNVAWTEAASVCELILVSGQGVLVAPSWARSWALPLRVKGARPHSLAAALSPSSSRHVHTKKSCEAPRPPCGESNRTGVEAGDGDGGGGGRCAHVQPPTRRP